MQLILSKRFGNMNKIRQDINLSLIHILITEKKAGARWYVRLGRALLRIFAPLM